MVLVVVAEGVAEGVIVTVGVTGVRVGRGVRVGSAVGSLVAVAVTVAVGSFVAVGKKVLVGQAVGEGGTTSLTNVLVDVGDITAGKVGGVISSSVRGAVAIK